MTRLFFYLLAVGMALLPLSAFALEIRQPTPGGSRAITIDQPVNDNLLVVGETVIVKAPVTGDFAAAGERVEVNAPVSGNVFIAGGMLQINAAVSGDAFVAGQNLSVSDAGKIGRDLYVWAAATSGIEGKVGGKTVQPPVTKPVSPGQRARNTIFAGLALLFTGIVLIRIFPKATAAMADNLLPHWGKNFLAGIITLIVAPIVAAFLIASSIGVPVGLVLLALWLWELYVGLVVATYTIGRLVLKNHPNELVRFALGALIITVIGFIPGIAGTVKFILILFGLGSIVLAKYDLYQKLRSQL